MEIESKQQILERRKEIEQELMEMLEETGRSGRRRVRAEVILKHQ